MQYIKSTLPNRETISLMEVDISSGGGALSIEAAIDLLLVLSSDAGNILCLV